ncbi:MAG TPA: glutamate--tRNA ligase [bacterium]
MSDVRVRYAPSPTGYLHVGGLRTALYNYLFARQHGGTFVLRIEDTDQTRKVEGAVENLLEVLEWLGLEFDEGPSRGGEYGPYVQSERLEMYREHVRILAGTGHAYPCFCSSAELDAMRLDQQARGRVPMYDRRCRRMDPAAAKARIDAGEPHVWRMAVPERRVLMISDVIRGDVRFDTDTVDDQVLLKSDGFPTYHLANVVDDHFMKISHVIRGEEWLPSTPKHVLLYEFFGWTAPVFAHLPLLLNADRSKMSKRSGDVAVEEYRKKGILPQALINFVALLGWHPQDDREVFTVPELIHEFSLERVNKAGAIFDMAKLEWMNGEHLRMLSDEAALDYLLQFTNGSVSRDVLRQVWPMMKTRIRLPKDLFGDNLYFFADPVEYDPAGVAKHFANPEIMQVLDAYRDELGRVEPFDAATLEAHLRALAERHTLSAGKLIHPTRLALTGKTVSPGLFEMMEMLGRDTVVRRLAKALRR